MKYTTKELVINAFIENPDIAPDDLVKLVKCKVKRTAFNRRHVSFYKHHICKSNGRYRQEFMRMLSDSQDFESDFLKLKRHYREKYEFKFETELDSRNQRDPYKVYIVMLLSPATKDKGLSHCNFLPDYSNNQALREADESELRTKLRGLGRQNRNAAFLSKNAKTIKNEYSGELPKEKILLEKLRGVGPKIAGCISSYGFLEPDFPLDTHGVRIVRRYRGYNSLTCDSIREYLKNKFKKRDWIDIHELLRLHGILICRSKKRQCDKCRLRGCKDRKCSFKENISLDKVKNVEKEWNEWRNMLLK